MTESNWQGDMLRQMAEQPPAEEQARTDNPPAPAEPGPEAPPAPAPPQQQYPPQPYPQEQYPPQQYDQQPYTPQQYDQQPYPPQQYYPPQQPYEQYPPQPYPQEQYPPQQYPQQQYGQGQYPSPQPDPYQYMPPPQHYAPQQPPPQPQQDGWGAPQPQQEGDEGDSVFRHFRRIASEAAYLIGASGRMQRDVDHIATIRRPIAIMRRVGVLSPVTDGGTSTVTALLATMLAAQRSDRVVAVDVDPAGAELSRRLELSLGAGPIEGVSLVRSDASADAVRTTLAEVQGQGARDVGLAVVDCPGTMFDEIATVMASSGHCAVLVVPSAQQVANYCLTQLDQLTPDGQDVLLSRGVVVITMVENVHPGSINWLVEAFRQRGLEPIVLPYDVHIAQAWPMHTEELQAETRRAVLDLAARVVDTVTRTAS
ncbi:MinD/ParA family protein [Kribbella sp. NPDC050241]|uniref:MinD/ParA family protein n=1 Tax=Kribbella sp. NPDC050241 TaxID=3364115 RepID=UPI0037B84835